MAQTSLKPISVLLIEDNGMVRHYVKLLVGGAPGFLLVGAATTGAEGLRMARDLRPAIVLLDLILPDVDGFSLARELARGEVAPKILVLTERQDEVALEATSRPPFCGLVIKSTLDEARLTHALREVAQGRAYFSEEVTAANRELRRRGASWLNMFTAAERDLMAAFGEGLPDDAIAARRGGSAHTVRRHRQSVLAKLGLHSSSELAQWALAKGFVVPVPGRHVELRCGADSREPWPR